MNASDVFNGSRQTPTRISLPQRPGPHSPGYIDLVPDAVVPGLGGFKLSFFHLSTGPQRPSPLLHGASVGATLIAAARKTELRRGVNDEVTPPASYRLGICAQSTHNLTLKLTEPLAWRIRSHTRRISLGRRWKMNSTRGRVLRTNARRRTPLSNSTR